MEIKLNKQIIQHLVLNNKKKYNMHKASEEMQELGLVLNQKLLKPTKVKKQEIIDEIGDVIIRLEVLKHLYSTKKIQERVNEKLASYKSWIKTNKYKQI